MTAKASSGERGSAEQSGQAESPSSEVNQGDSGFKKDLLCGQSKKIHNTSLNRVSASKRKSKDTAEKKENELSAATGKEQVGQKAAPPQCAECAMQISNVFQEVSGNALDVATIEDVEAGNGQGDTPLLSEVDESPGTTQAKPIIVGSNQKWIHTLSTKLEQRDPGAGPQGGESGSTSSVSIHHKSLENSTIPEELNTDRVTTISPKKKVHSTAELSQRQDSVQTRSVTEEADSVEGRKLLVASPFEAKSIDQEKTHKIVQKESEAKDVVEKLRALGREADAPPSVRSRPASSSMSGRISSTSGEEAPHLSQQDKVELVQRVFHAVRLARLRDGELRLRLHPPELGALRVELRVEGGALMARLEAESPAARDLLMDNLPDLRQRLAEHRLKIERFDVTLMSQSNSGGGSQQHTASFHAPRPSGMRWNDQGSVITEEQDHPVLGTRSISSLFDVIA